MRKTCDNTCAVKYIAKVWMIKGWNVVKKENKNEEELVQYITKKFQYILKKIWCEEETFRSISKSGGNGHFNFKCKTGKTPVLIKKIFDKYDETKGIYTSEEIIELEDMLAEIISDYGWNRSNPDKKREGLQNYYLKSRNSDFFEKRIFVKIDQKNRKLTKAVRYKFYQEQYEMIRLWENKWNFIMNKAKILRINDRVYFGYIHEIAKKMPSKKDKESFYKTGMGLTKEFQEEYSMYDRISRDFMYESCLILYENRQKNACDMGKEKKEKIHMDCDKCCSECSKIVRKVINSDLQQISPKDYDYIKIKAFIELEMLHSQMIETAATLEMLEQQENIKRLKEEQTEKYVRYYCREVGNFLDDVKTNSEDSKMFLKIKEEFCIQRRDVLFDMAPNEKLKEIYYKIKSPL